MSQNQYSLTREERREYNRLMLRSAFKSLFWLIFSDKRNSEQYKLQDLADSLGKNKSIVSRWFTSEPNWTIDTIADIADALDVSIHIQAKQKNTLTIYSATETINKHSLFKMKKNIWQNDVQSILTAKPVERDIYKIHPDRRRSAMAEHNMRATGKLPSENTSLFIAHINHQRQ